jgi:hypothetical protein
VLLMSLFFIAITFQLKAQLPVFDSCTHVAPPQAKKNKDNYDNLYIYSKDEFLVSDKTKDGLIFSVYDAHTLQPQSTFTLKDPLVDGHEASWIKRYIRGDEITSFYSYYDKKEENYTVYGKVAIRDDKSIVNEKILESFSVAKKDDIGEVSITSSGDKSKFLIHREPKIKYEPQAVIELCMYDSHLVKIYNKKFRFPNNEKLVVKDYLVTNSGKVVVIAYLITPGPGIEDYISYKIFGVNEEGEELEEIIIATGRKGLGSVFGFIVDSGKSIAFTGFYGNNMEDNSGTGIFYAKVNTGSLEVEKIKLNNFTEYDIDNITINQPISPKITDKIRKQYYRVRANEVFNLVVKNLLFENDGSIKIVTQLERITSAGPVIKGKVNQGSYTNHQIVEFDLDHNGKTIQIATILKLQFGSGNGSNTRMFSSFVHYDQDYLGHIELRSATSLFYIYNDLDGFYNAKFPKKAKDDHSLSFVRAGKYRLAYAYNAEGPDSKYPMDKIAMTNSNKNNVSILPSCDVLEMPDGSVIVWGEITKTEKLVLMRFYLK